MNQEQDKQKKSNSFFVGLIKGFLYFYSPFAKKIKSCFLFFYESKYDTGYLLGCFVGMMFFLLL